MGPRPFFVSLTLSLRFGPGLHASSHLINNTGRGQKIKKKGPKRTLKQPQRKEGKRRLGGLSCCSVTLDDEDGDGDAGDDDDGEDGDDGDDGDGDMHAHED